MAVPAPGYEFFGHRRQVGEVGAVNVQPDADAHAQLERHGDVPGDPFVGAAAVGIDAPRIVLLGRAVESDLKAGDAGGAEEVAIGVKLRAVGDGPEVRLAHLEGLAQKGFDDGPVGREQRLAAEEAEVAAPQGLRIEAMALFDLRQGGENAIDHGPAHGAQQVLEAAVAAHVVLITVRAPEIAVVGRHEDIAGSLPERALVELHGELGEKGFFFFGRQLGEISLGVEALEGRV